MGISIHFATDLRHETLALRAILTFTLAAMCLALPLHSQAVGFEKYRHHTKFDDHFSKYSKRFFGIGFDWKYFKAQAIAESNLNPNAKSYVGAVGVMQLMPRTFEEVSRKSKVIEKLPEDPRWNIAAGIWYNKQQFDFWKKDRELEERLKFMYGSYNSGRYNLLKAQRQAIDKGLNPRKWDSMYQALPLITGKHSKETLNYVERVFKIKEAIE
jgi:membrane-bound lytic murein transglycosylase F